MAYTTINKSSDYFNTLIYTGNGSNPRTLTGVGFQPDFVWLKNRTDANGHTLADAVRGANKTLSSDGSGAEVTDKSDGHLDAFTSDGFTVGAGTDDARVNNSGSNYVAWNWLASNTTASNTDGSITSTVSANTTSGFSIVSYSGATGGGSVGHGLGVKPDIVLIKCRSAIANWLFTTDIIDGSKDYLFLNQTNAKGNLTTALPTSSVFTVSGDDDQGENGKTYVAYCFAEKKGFSKFGSYTGAGSNLPFIYTGFKPAFVILKRTDTTGYNWVLSDAVRDTDNAVEKYVHPNTSDAEQSGSRDIDFLSNGFKMRNTNTTWNASGGTYIYMAFAEAPLVGSNNVPATAR